MISLRSAVLAAGVVTLSAACSASFDGGPAGTDPGGVPGGPGVVAATSATDARSLAGRVLSGETPVVGAAIVVMAAGSPAASGPTALAQTTTDETGRFTVTLRCPNTAGASSADLIYATAVGGSAMAAGSNAMAAGSNAMAAGVSSMAVSGTGAGVSAQNTAIELVTAIGSCAKAPATITLDELTTVAAGYALNAFIGSGGVTGGTVGLANAVATAALLADPVTGALSTSLPTSPTCDADPQAPDCELVQKLVSLANALQSCTSASAASASPCVALFACATPGSIPEEPGGCTPPAAGELPDGARAPTNTLDAVLSAARNPGTVAVTAIYQLAAASSVYGSVAGSPPNDWTLALTFTDGGLSEPTALALDASGNAWIANYNGAVTKLSPTGVPLSPPGGFTGGGIEESFGIAIDAAGNVWVCNEQSGAEANNGLGSVTELAPDGSLLSGQTGFVGGGLSFPDAIVADAAGHIWVANYGNSTLTELAGDGTALSPETGYVGGGLTFPVDVKLDDSGNLWIADQGDNQVSLFSPEGTALSPANGFQGGGLAVPQALAVDAQGHVWITNYYGNSVTELDSHGDPLSGDQGFSGGGLRAPGGIAIDGAGTVWVANYQGKSLTALAGSAASSPGAPLSPMNGYTSTNLVQPFSVAIDPSGNVWVTDFGSDSVTEFVGLAAPVRTPLIGVPQSP